MDKCIEWLLMATLMAGLPVALYAQAPSDWQDPSPHKVQLITVDDGVQLKVLDWGGSGPPIVLLAGLGNTAHVYDDFAQKLTRNYHVNGYYTTRFWLLQWAPSGCDVDTFGRITAFRKMQKNASIS